MEINGNNCEDKTRKKRKATVTKEEIIVKLKDESDFDNRRLKIIRKLKDNEELRNNIVSIVRQPSVLDRAGAETMKPRQLSDAIYDEVGDKMMSQLSDGLWKIIRSEDGMKTEIAGTVQSVYENSPVNRNGKCNTRYFIIKSLNHDNLQLSVEKGLWATQVMNEPILEEAFHNSGKVILIFSVNMSGFFQGYAQMMSSVGWRRDNIWNQGSGKNNPWGRSFKVKWLRLNDLPFQKTLHLRNPLNDFKPVKISRDCQELPEDIGEALCELIDGEGEDVGIMRRPCLEPPCTSSEEYNAFPHHAPWDWTHMTYPSLFYQQNTEASRILGHQGFGGTLPELPPSSGVSKVSKTKHSRMNGNISNLRVHCNIPAQLDVWGLPAESPLASTLTDDDFLEMTYEEYLEVHTKSIKQLNLPVAGPSQTKDGQSSKSRDNDSNSSDQSSRKRPRDSLEEK